MKPMTFLPVFLLVYYVGQSLAFASVPSSAGDCQTCPSVSKPPTTASTTTQTATLTTKLTATPTTAQTTTHGAAQTAPPTTTGTTTPTSTLVTTTTVPTSMIASTPVATQITTLPATSTTNSAYITSTGEGAADSSISLGSIAAIGSLAALLIGAVIIFVLQIRKAPAEYDESITLPYGSRRASLATAGSDSDSRVYYAFNRKSVRGQLPGDNCASDNTSSRLYADMSYKSAEARDRNHYGRDDYRTTSVARGSVGSRPGRKESDYARYSEVRAKLATGNHGDKRDLSGTTGSFYNSCSHDYVVPINITGQRDTSNISPNSAAYQDNSGSQGYVTPRFGVSLVTSASAPSFDSFASVPSWQELCQLPTTGKRPHPHDTADYVVGSSYTLPQGVGAASSEQGNSAV